jgi:hypothetical protein
MGRRWRWGVVAGERGFMDLVAVSLGGISRGCSRPGAFGNEDGVEIDLHKLNTASVGSVISISCRPHQNLTITSVSK